MITTYWTCISHLFTSSLCPCSIPSQYFPVASQNRCILSAVLGFALGSRGRISSHLLSGKSAPGDDGNTANLEDCSGHNQLHILGHSFGASIATHTSCRLSFGVELLGRSVNSSSKCTLPNFDSFACYGKSRKGLQTLAMCGRSVGQKKPWRAKNPIGQWSQKHATPDMDSSDV